MPVTTSQTFCLPDAGEGLTEAEITRWAVDVGDLVELNQVVVEIETAKSVVELPSPYAGVVERLEAPVGTVVAVGEPIMVVGAAGPGTAAQDTAAQDTATQGPAASGSVLVGYGTAGPRPTTHPTQGEKLTEGAASAAGVAVAEAQVLAKPPVRALAKQLGVDIGSVTPSGPGGIVTREDVCAQAEAQAPERLALYEGDAAEADASPWLSGGTVSRDGRTTRVGVRSVRKRTAEAMVASAFTAPHVTVFHTLDVSKTMKMVATLKQDPEFAGVRVTPLLVVAKALILAVRRHPEINASWDEAAQEIVYKHYINLGIAAATPRGLVVPNIKNAHRLGLRDLAAELTALTQTARAGTTRPSAMADGTITITNVGAFGIDSGTPILTPGEAAILAFGAIRRRPWVRGGRVKARWVTELALSFDHRLVDGALGAVVLSDVARILQDPAQALVWA